TGGRFRSERRFDLSWREARVAGGNGGSWGLGLHSFRSGAGGPSGTFGAGRHTVFRRPLDDAVSGALAAGPFRGGFFGTRHGARQWYAKQCADAPRLGRD